MAGTAIDTATPIYNSNDQAMQNMLATQQTLKAHYENLDSREKSRLQSVIAGAVQLKPFLDNNDVKGATDFLTKRRAELQTRMGSGENVDTQETDYALSALQSGNTQQLSQEIQGLMAAGQVYGILGQSDAPSNVQEWQYYNQLSPQDQERYLTMKRSNSVVNLGGSQIVPSQVNPAGAPQASFPVSPKPEEMPNFIAQQEAAKLEGRGEVSPREQVAKGKERTSFVLDEMRKEYGTLQQKGAAVDTSRPAVDNIGAYAAGTGVGQAIGRAVGSEEQSIRNNIQQKIPMLIGAIMQATGLSASQLNSNAELQFYLQQATNVSNDVQSNMKALDMLDYLYGSKGIRLEGMGQGAGPQNNGSQGPVEVTSEQEALQLPAGTKFMLNGKTGTVQ